MQPLGATGHRPAIPSQEFSISLRDLKNDDNEATDEDPVPTAEGNIRRTRRSSAGDKEPGRIRRIDWVVLPFGKFRSRAFHDTPWLELDLAAYCVSVDPGRRKTWGCHPYPFSIGL